jgi:undecaprenyl-diphosphatase
MHDVEAIDLGALFWFTSQREPHLNNFMLQITHLGDREVVIAVMVGAIIGLLIGGRCRSALILFLSSLLAYGINEFTKVGVARPRPEVASVLGPRPHSYSFPSSHALLTAAVYGSLALLWIGQLRSRLKKTLVVSLAVVVVMIVGVSRLYIGVHYLTDVLGGWIAGGACAFLCAWADRRWSRPAPE